MQPELVSLLIQIPLVAAFMWFTVAMVKAWRAATEADQDRLLEHESGLQRATHEFIADQNKQWQSIMQIERERRKEAMDQGLREVNTVSEAITRLADALAQQSEAFSRHDAGAVERHKALIDHMKGRE